MESFNFIPKCTVGVFDSGIGGLNLLKTCVLKMPYVNFVYFADNYAVPYGNKPKEEITKRVTGAFDIMIKMQVAAAVVACNTATAVCVDVLRKRCPFPVVGIQPAVKQAASYGGRCAVLCTEATAESQSLKVLVERFGEGRARVYPCPDLASFIEERAPEIPVREAERLLPEIEADSVVLGCTHYLYIKNTIQNKYQVPVFDGMVGTAAHLATLLGFCDHLSKNAGKIHFVGGNNGKKYDNFQHLMKIPTI